MYYDRGRHVELLLLTADRVLHDGDVVGRSDGFDMTTKDAC